MNKRLSVLNLISVLLVIAINYATQALRVNEATIGEVSNKYYNLFTPAGYSFAIWGLIFLGLVAYSIYQVKMAFFSNKPYVLIEKTGYWLILANLLNCVWVFVFTYEYTGLSVIVMVGILISLLQIILKTNMNKESVSGSTKLFAWLPIGIYTGWISVALIANIAAYLSKLNWDGGPLTAQQWTITMIIIATLLNIFMVWKRNMREFALVGIWALFAIYIRHSENFNTLSTIALVCCCILALVITIHIFQSRKTNRIYNSNKNSDIN